MIIIAGVHVIKRIGLEMKDNNPYSLKQIGIIMSQTNCFDVMKYLAEHKRGTRRQMIKCLSKSEYDYKKKRNVLHWTLRRMRDLQLVNLPSKQEALEFGVVETYTLTERGKKLFMTAMDFVKVSDNLPSFTMEILQKNKTRLEKQMGNLSKEIEQEKQLKSTKQMKFKNEVF